MSKAPDTGEIRRCSKPPVDKSTFIRTCNLLSKFIKEKRFAGDTSKGIAAKLEHIDKTAKTMNLLTNKDSSNDASKEIAAAMEFLPQFLHNSSNNESDSSIDMKGKMRPNMPFLEEMDRLISNSRRVEQILSFGQLFSIDHVYKYEEGDSLRENQQLTIFYCGKVLVFNDFAAENATEIMEMATKLSSNNTFTEDKTQTSVPVPPPEANNIALPATNNTNTEQEGPRTGSQPSGSNLKIARRASLHKFFEKRKERNTARGPYPLNNAAITSYKPDGESSSGPSDADRDHGQSSKELDLKL